MDISNGVVSAIQRNTARYTAISWDALHVSPNFNSEIDNVSSNQLTSTAFNTILINVQDASRGIFLIRVNAFQFHQTASHWMLMAIVVNAIQLML